jgi:hypothetical protein
MNNPMQTFMQLVQSTKNPQQVLQQIQHMAQNNPQFSAALNQFNIANNQMRQSGMSMKQYVLQYAKQNGCNPQQIINDLSNMGIKL